MQEQAGVQVGVREGQAGVQAGGQVGQAEGQGVQARGQVGVQGGQAKGQGVQAGLGVREVDMLRACVQESATSRELQAAAGFAGRTRSFEQRLNGLLAEGLLEMTVPDRPRSPGQRYRLTNKGRLALGGAVEGHEEPDA